MSLPERLRELIDRSALADGAPPFSDQSLVDAAEGARRVVLEETGAAIHSDRELELVIDPRQRGRGHGTALLDRVLAGTSRPVSAWSHGDLPAARALAEKRGFRRSRVLLQLRAPVSPAEPAPPSGWTLRPFVAGEDERAWLELNGLAFAHHPEQGSLTLRDLEAREAEEWFRAEDLLLLERDGLLLGSCWLKVTEGVGEFYAVAVHPDHQGQGLGGVLMDAGMARLARQGLTVSSLYVEGDNDRALALYRSRGFEVHTRDVQWRLDGPAPLS